MSLNKKTAPTIIAILSIASNTGKTRFKFCFATAYSESQFNFGLFKSTIIIAILCNINKRITYHTSRHTFASTVTLANNISLEVVSKMLGHTNTRMTAHYAKLVDETIANQMDKIANVFDE